MNKPKVLIVTIPGMIASSDWAKLKNIAEVTYVEQQSVTQEQLIDLLENIDYLMLNFDVIKKLDNSFYKSIKYKNLPLKAISADITGMSWADIDSANEYGITLMQTPNYSTVSVAEYIIALLLLHVKGLNEMFEDRAAGKPDEAKKNDVLYEKTLGIVGLGNIGRYVAGIAKGFGMNVVAWNRSTITLEGIKLVSLDELFSRSNYISINLATNKETESMIDKKYLDLMKPGTIIINEADGPIVNNDDLVNAMQAGRVKVYTARESNAQTHPVLQKQKEFKPVPASAWFTDHSLSELRKTWVENVITHINGSPQNLVTEQ